MSAQITQLFIAVDRRSDGSHRVSLVYNAASNPNPNPSSLLPCLSPLVPLFSSCYRIRLTHPPPSNPPHPSPSLRSAAPAPTLPRKSTGILDFSAALEESFLDALCSGGGASLFSCLGPWRGTGGGGSLEGSLVSDPAWARARDGGNARKRKAPCQAQPLYVCRAATFVRHGSQQGARITPPPPPSILHRLYFGGSGQSHFPNNCARHPLWPQILPYITSPILGFDLAGRNACAYVTTVTV
jgi:hypothetical protein